VMVALWVALIAMGAGIIFFFRGAL
jgi:hypothetical protein